jgi:hypothetical protein
MQLDDGDVRVQEWNLPQDVRADGRVGLDDLELPT